MKTNREMVVSYKVMYDDESKFLCDKLLAIVEAHAEWLRETPWENIGGDGRVAINDVGIFEWEVIYDAETPQDTED